MASQTETPIYKDPSQPIEKRVEDLLGRMTLREKVGQLNMPFPLPSMFAAFLGRQMPSTLEDCQQFAEGVFSKEVGPGGGFFQLPEMVIEGAAHQQAETLNALQAIALEKTRLGIPLLQTVEGTHGALLPGATIYPEGLALGSTWNIDLIEDIYAAVAREARAVGVHQLCTLVVEPNRDPRLGRNCEAYAEDPYLCARIARSIVRGVQEHNVAAADKAVAVLCHFPGQSEPTSGLERGAMDISERTLREVFLPPWVAGIKEAGTLGVMATYPAIDGVPAHASSQLLTKVLREELGFRGLVLSEGNGLDTLLYENLVTTQKQAGALALNAGVDVSVTYEQGYLEPLIENVEEGRVAIEIVDRAVRRILSLKFRLGLFEGPLVDPERAAQVMHSEKHQELALQAAREGIVLLKNKGGLLPLDTGLKSIAVIGPNADDGLNQLGDYTTSSVRQPVVTVLEGIKAKAAPGTQITHVRGCEILGHDTGGFAEARQAARDADVAIVVVGEKPVRFTEEGMAGTVGEGADVASLDLTGVQEALIQAVQETGTPTVVVLINGRPLSIRWTAEHVPAIVEAWFPGEQGGTAVAEVLFGDCNPSGRLPITVPRHAGQLPVYYNHKPSKAHGMMGRADYVDLPATPLYEFGFGLGYTQFEYSDLRIEPQVIRPAAHVCIRADVTNVGGRQGEEVVQLYIHDLVASVSTPVKQLRGFQKVGLAPGETKTVTFTLAPADLALYDQNMNWVVEPGTFEIMVGASSEDIRLHGSLEVRS